MKAKIKATRHGWTAPQIFSRRPSRGVYGEEGLLNNIHYYNNERISQKLKGLRPVEYRSQALKAA